MPLFGKGKSAKYDYYLLLHNLSPFPANYKSIYISWQRGSGKRGQTKAVGPTSTGPGRSWATYQFEDALHVDCTLNQVRFDVAIRSAKAWTFIKAKHTYAGCKGIRCGLAGLKRFG